MGRGCGCRGRFRWSFGVRHDPFAKDSVREIAVPSDASPAIRPTWWSVKWPVWKSFHADSDYNAAVLLRQGVTAVRVTVLAWPASSQRRRYSEFRIRLVGVLAARRPGMAATTLARTSAPSATSPMARSGTVGSGMAKSSCAKRSHMAWPKTMPSGTPIQTPMATVTVDCQATTAESWPRVKPSALRRARSRLRRRTEVEKGQSESGHGTGGQPDGQDQRSRSDGLIVGDLGRADVGEAEDAGGPGLEPVQRLHHGGERALCRRRAHRRSEAHEDGVRAGVGQAEERRHARGDQALVDEGARADGEVQAEPDADGGHGGHAHDVQHGRLGPAGHADGVAQPLVQVGQGLGSQDDLIGCIDFVAGQEGRTDSGSRVTGDDRNGLPVEEQRVEVDTGPACDGVVVVEQPSGQGLRDVAVPRVRLEHGAPDSIRRGGECR